MTKEEKEILEQWLQKATHDLIAASERHLAFGGWLFSTVISSEVKRKEKAHHGLQYTCYEVVQGA